MKYSDLINVDDFKKRDVFHEDRGEIAYFCKDCNAIVEVEQKKTGKYEFICKVCGGKHIAVWTHAWLVDNYRIKK